MLAVMAGIKVPAMATKPLLTPLSQAALLFKCRLILWLVRARVVMVMAIIVMALDQKVAIRLADHFLFLALETWKRVVGPIPRAAAGAVQVQTEIGRASLNG